MSFDVPPPSHDPGPQAAAALPPTPPASPLTGAEAPQAAPARRRLRRPRASLVVIVLLSLALVASVGFLTYSLVQANAVIDKRDNTIDERDRTIEEQEDLIEKKETFGAAMAGMLTTASRFNGTVVGELVPTDDFSRVADRAWAHRWDAAKLDDDIAEVQVVIEKMEAQLAEAGAQTASNGTASAYETTIDQLGAGFVTSVIDDADTFCGRDVIACVSSVDPLVVHFDAADHSLPYMTDWLRTGIAYHEFAHVLQFTHPDETDDAVEFFAGDSETMADCFALTFLDGWKLDHTIWTSSREYWEVSLGYGLTCDQTQRQAVRDWYGSLGYTVAEVGQGD